MKIDWQIWIAQQDLRIRATQNKLVSNEMRKLNLKKIPREYIAPVADIARRLSMSHWMLRLLNPYVNSTSEVTFAFAREQALYAVALARIGAHRESEQRILRINDLSKEVLLLKASAWISLWKYRQAQSIYVYLLKLKTLTEYERRIAEINLAACYVNQGKYSEAVTLLNSFSNWREEFPLLYGNSRELFAQAYLGLKQYSKAEEMARESSHVLGRGAGAYSLFAKKWLLIAQSLACGCISNESWQEFYDSALERKDSETLRDLALFKAAITMNANDFSSVYIGTPYESYRKKALKQFKIAFKIPKSVLRLPENRNPMKTLDLELGLYTDSQKEVEITGKSLEILRILNRDFFRSTPTGELFSFLYPDEVFNITSSPHRVYQLVYQLNKFLNDHQIHIQIHREKHLYQIKTDSVAIRVFIKYQTKNHKKDAERRSILSNFKSWMLSNPCKFFQRKDLEEQFSISKTTALKWLKLGRQNKIFTSQSAGNRSIYVPNLSLNLKTPMSGLQKASSLNSQSQIKIEKQSPNVRISRKKIESAA